MKTKLTLLVMAIVASTTAYSASNAAKYCAEKESDKYDECLIGLSKSLSANIDIIVERISNKLSTDPKFQMPKLAVETLQKTQSSWALYMEAQCNLDDNVWLTNGRGNRIFCELEMKEQRKAALEKFEKGLE